MVGPSAVFGGVVVMVTAVNVLNPSQTRDFFNAGKIGWWTVKPNLFLEVNHAMSRLTHRCHIVGDHQDGLVVIVAKIVQQLKQRLARCSVHTNHRFVKQEKFCFPRKCSCNNCLLYTSPSPRDGTSSRMPSSA